MQKETDEARRKRAEAYDAAHPIRDYHDFTYPSMSKEECDKLFVGPLYINGGWCEACNTFIRSRNKHDYVTCRCGKNSVDGGSHYQKISSGGSFKPITVPFDWAKEPSNAALLNSTGNNDGRQYPTRRKTFKRLPVELCKPDDSTE